MEMKELEIVQLIAVHGDVATIKVVRDRATRKCKGYAFVEMVSMDDALNVIDNLNGRTIGDRELTIKLAEEGSAKPKSAPSRPRTFNKPSGPRDQGSSSDARQKRPRRNF